MRRTACLLLLLASQAYSQQFGGGGIPAIPDADLDSSSVTLQGNSFNTASKLTQLDSNSNLTLTYGVQSATLTASGQAIVQGTMTVQGNAFSVGGSTLTVSLGTTTVAGNLQVTASTVNVRGNTSGYYSQIGYVGEISSGTLGTSNSPGASGTFVDLSTITITAGQWLVIALGEIDPGGTTAATNVTFGISTSANGIDSGTTLNRCQYGFTQIANDNNSCMFMRIMNVTATTTVYLTGGLTYSVLGGAVFNTNNGLWAYRLR